MRFVAVTSPFLRMKSRSDFYEIRHKPGHVSFQFGTNIIVDILLSGMEVHTKIKLTPGSCGTLRHKILDPQITTTFEQIVI